MEISFLIVFKRNYNISDFSISDFLYFLRLVGLKKFGINNSNFEKLNAKYYFI